jgi:hypothetical protein
MQQYHDLKLNILKFVTPICVSANSAITGCNEIQGNCCAFHARTHTHTIYITFTLL